MVWLTDNIVNTYNKLLFTSSETGTHALLYILLASALLISSRLIHSEGWRQALEAAEALPFLFPLCFLSPLISLFPSLPSLWKVSLKGPRWKAALNGSVIAETVLAAQGATRIAHSVAPCDKNAHRHRPKVCACAGLFISLFPTQNYSTSVQMECLLHHKKMLQCAMTHRPQPHTDKYSYM